MTIRKSLVPAMNRMFGRALVESKTKRKRLAFRPVMDDRLETRKLLALLYSANSNGAVLNISIFASSPDTDPAPELKMLAFDTSGVVTLLNNIDGTIPITGIAGYQTINISVTADISGTPKPFSLIVQSGPQGQVSGSNGTAPVALNGLSITSVGGFANLTMSQSFNGTLSAGDLNYFPNVSLTTNTANLNQAVRFAANGANINFTTTASNLAANNVDITKSLTLNGTLAGGTALNTSAGSSAFLLNPSATNATLTVNGNVSLAASASANPAFAFQSNNTTLVLGTYTQNNISSNYSIPLNVASGACAVLGSNFNGSANGAGSLTIGTGFTQSGDVNLTGSGSLTLTSGACLSGAANLSGATTSLQALSGALGITGNVTSNGTVNLTSGSYGGVFALTDATTTISGGTFSGLITFSNGTAALSGGTFSNNIALNNTTATLSGGNFSGNVTQTNGTSTVNGTANVSGNIVNNNGSLTINTSNTVANTVNITPNGSLVFSAGRVSTLIANTTGAVNVNGTANVSANLNITNANVNVSGTAVVSNVTVQAGQVNVTNSGGISGNLTVSSGANAIGGFNVGNSANILGCATIGNVTNNVNVSSTGNLTANNIGGFAYIQGLANVGNVTGNATSIGGSANLTALNVGNLSVSGGGRASVARVIGTSATATVNGGNATVSNGVNGTVSVNGTGSNFNLTGGTVNGSVSIANGSNFLASGSSVVSGTINLTGSGSNLSSTGSANLAGNLNFDPGTTGSLTSSTPVGGNLTLNNATVTSTSNITGLITLNNANTQLSVLTLNANNTNGTAPSLGQNSTLNLGTNGSVASLNIAANNVVSMTSDGSVRGDVSVTGGNLTSINNGVIGGNVTVNSSAAVANVNLASTGAISGNLSVNQPGGFLANVIVSSPISGSNITVANGSLTLGGISTFNGTLSISGGTTCLTSGRVVNGTTTVTGGTFRYNSTETQNGSFSFTNATVNLTSGTRNFTGNMTISNTTVSNGTMNLTSGNLTVTSGANISAGLVLSCASSSRTATVDGGSNLSGPVTVGSNYTLTVNSTTAPTGLTIVNGGTATLNNATSIGASGINSNGTLNIGVVAISVNGPITFGSGSSLLLNYNESVTVPGSTSNASYINVTNSSAAVSVNGTIELATLQQQSVNSLNNITFLLTGNNTANAISSSFSNAGDVTNDVNLGIEVVKTGNTTLSLGNYTAPTIFVDDNLFATNGTQTFWIAGGETKALLGTNAFTNLTSALATNVTFMTDNSNLVIGSGTYATGLDLTQGGSKVGNLSVSLANMSASNITAVAANVSLTGNLVLTSNNTLTFGLFNSTPTTADKIIVNSGNITLGGADLNLRAGFGAMASLPNNLSNVLTLVDNVSGNAVTGAFGSVSDGANNVNVTGYSGTGTVGNAWYFRQLNGLTYNNDIGVVVAPGTIDNSVGEVKVNNGSSSTIGTVDANGIVGLNVWNNISSALTVTNVSNGTLRIFGGDYANGALSFAGNGNSSSLTVVAGQNATANQTVNITGAVAFAGNTTFRADANGTNDYNRLTATNISYGGVNNTISVNVPASVPLLTSYTFLQSVGSNTTGSANNLTVGDGTNLNTTAVSFGTPIVVGGANFTPACVSNSSSFDSFRLIRTANGTQTYGNVAACAPQTGTFGQDILGTGGPYIYGITFFSNATGSLQSAFDVVGANSTLTILGNSTFSGNATVSRNFVLARESGVTSDLAGNLTFLTNGTMQNWTTAGQWFNVQGDIVVEGYGSSNDIATFRPFELVANNTGSKNLTFGDGTFTNANLVYSFGNTHPTGTLQISGCSTTGTPTILSPGSSGTAIDLSSNTPGRSLTLANLSFAGGPVSGDLIKLATNQTGANAPIYTMSNLLVMDATNVTSLANVSGSIQSLTVNGNDGNNTFTLLESGLYSSTQWLDEGILFSKNNLTGMTVFGLGGNDTFNIGNGTNSANFVGKATVNGGDGNDNLVINNVDTAANASTASGLTSFDGGSGINTLQTIQSNSNSSRGYMFTLSGNLSGNVSYGTVSGSIRTSLGAASNYANVSNLIGSSGGDTFTVSNLTASDIGRVTSINGSTGSDKLAISGAGGLYTTTTMRRFYQDPQDPSTLIQDGYMAVNSNVSTANTSASYAIETFDNLEIFEGGASYDVYEFIGNPNYASSIDAGSGGGALNFTNYFNADQVTNFTIPGVSVSLIRKSATLVGSGANDKIANITAVYGSSFNDTLYGSTGNDILYGSAGNDFIDGGQGHDIVIGDYGADTVVSGTGFDLITGDIYDPYTNNPGLTIPLPIVMERIQSQIWNGIANTTAFDSAVDRLRVGNGSGSMTRLDNNTTLTAPSGYGNTIAIPVFIGQDTPTAANGTNYTFLNDNSTDVIRMIGTGAPGSATYLLYSAGPTNTSLSDNITGIQLGIRRRNRTYIIPNS